MMNNMRIKTERRASTPDHKVGSSNTWKPTENLKNAPKKIHNASDKDSDEVAA
jgi:hypothetical protein